MYHDFAYNGPITPICVEENNCLVWLWYDLVRDVERHDDKHYVYLARILRCTFDLQFPVSK